jgi:hypothetical protein
MLDPTGTRTACEAEGGNLRSSAVMEMATSQARNVRNQDIAQSM